MNAFDYLFENSKTLKKDFLAGKESVSYKQLYNDACNLAGFIRTTYGEGNNIMLVSVNNLFFINVYLAIIKSGNTCVPIDPAVETSNFTLLAGLTEPVAVFLTRDLTQKLPVGNLPCLFPDSAIFKEKRTIADNDDSFDENRCAEIIFTSGSTGKPKGVMISHKNLIANTRSIVSYLHLTSNDRMMVVLPFYYCYGLSLLHTHLRSGGSIVLNNSFIFLGSIIRSLLDYKCTGFAGVPSHFQILLRKTNEFKNSIFPDLRYVTQAGGKLAPLFIDEFRSNFPEIKFYVMYGQTEATARLSYLPPEFYDQKKGSIGRGIPDVVLKVVNEDGSEIMPGETGEVIAHGENIMTGYYKDEESTNEVLKNGWLYTGDLGTVDTDGYIYLTGRRKEIIKVGGKRISPKEIEAIILEIPEVVDCSVEGISDDLLGEIIKATVVVSSSSGISVNEDFIRQHCFSKLASFKVPQIIAITDQLKISSSGKKVKENPL